MSFIYDNPAFFSAYAEMPRSRGGLAAAGEWHQLGPLFPDVAGKAVLDLGCGYGWHCGYAAARSTGRWTTTSIPVCGRPCFWARKCRSTTTP